MAKGIPFDEANLQLGPPEGMTEEEVYTLPTLRVRVPDGSVECTSKWELSPEEFAEVMRTGCVWLSIEGTTHAPLRISGIYPYSSVEYRDTFSDAIESTDKYAAS